MYDELFRGDHPVTADDVAFYREHGYAQFDEVLGEEELEALRRGMERALAEPRGHVRDLGGGEGKEPPRLLQMLNLWEHHPEIKAYLFGGRIARMAARLAGSKVLHLYHDQALVKAPGPSAPAPWHQDQPYWPSREPGMFSCWMALDDVTVARGCMQFISGSHRWGEFPPVSFKGAGTTLEAQVSPAQRALWTPVPVELKAGSCTFHHGLTFHYTGPNTTSQTRRALVTIFIPEGVTYAGEEKMPNPFTDTITSRKGEPLRGTRFPRLI